MQENMLIIDQQKNNASSQVPKLEAIRNTILSIATTRGPAKSTCPSEIARLLFSEGWQAQMDQVRNMAIELHNQGKVVITQKGKPIEVKVIKGPIRIKIL